MVIVKLASSLPWTILGSNTLFMSILGWYTSTWIVSEFNVLLVQLILAWLLVVALSAPVGITFSLLTTV